jgi:STIP1 family protein 1
MSHLNLAEQLKEKGNAAFKREEYDEAIRQYSQAIQHNSTNPLLYTNRANARLKVKEWQGVIDDCLRSIELLHENMKGFYFLGKPSHLSIYHLNFILLPTL